MQALFQPVLLSRSLNCWLDDQHQQQAIEYLMEENRVLREQIGTRRNAI